jgi:hypothetical protein
VIRWLAVGLVAVAIGGGTASGHAPPRPATHDTGTPIAHHARTTAETTLRGDGPHVVAADAFTTDAPGLRPGQIEMTTIDVRPSLVAGHRVRIAVRGVRLGDMLVVTMNGRNVTRRFSRVASRPGQNQGAFEGTVAHLHLGANEVTARAIDEPFGTRSVQLRILDHPAQGPVISGPHQVPFQCETRREGLPASHRPDCAVASTYHWWYRDTEGNFHRLAHPFAPYPVGTSTAVVNGRRVPFVVRVDSEVINRAVTRFAVLDDPHARGRHAHFQPTEWNHNVSWHFGESCGTGYHQGTDGGEKAIFDPVTTVSSTNLAGPFLHIPSLLRDGYMVGQSSLTIFGVACNQVLAAETLMMAKQYIVDHYGDVVHLIGGGASGGAIQQYTIANAYPGVLDAGTPLLSFPDLVTVTMTLGDCTVLQHYFAGHPSWSVTRQDQVTGLETPQVCKDWSNGFSHLFSPTSCPRGVHRGGGVRCDLQDDLKNILGVSRRTHAALRPLDNVGVQYGLQAFKTGDITAAQFLDLNRSVGGLDDNGRFVRRRESMSRYEARRIFANSIVSENAAVNTAPMIDQTLVGSNLTPDIDIHDQIRPYEIRARLNRRYGNHNSQVIWSGATLPTSAIPVADSWLDRLDQLQVLRPWKSRAWLVAHSRPLAANDSCRVGTPSLPVRCTVGDQTGPRQIAGGPLTEDVFKCHLRPLRRHDYPASLTAAQFRTLRHVFGHGVCNYRRPSVGYVAHSRSWVSFGDGRGPSRPVKVPYPLVRSRVPH